MYVKYLEEYFTPGRRVAYFDGCQEQYPRGGAPL